jgi:DNA-binding MarR family transcriptional regulator
MKRKRFKCPNSSRHLNFFQKKQRKRYICTMRSYIEIITQWELFLSKSPTGDLEEFAHWLLEKNQERKAPQTAAFNAELQDYFDKNTSEYGYSDANSEAAYLIGRLSKFIKRYTKPLFLDLGISNQDEFAILAHVDYLKESSKKKIVEENLIEMSSGIDMISRLIKKGWLIERANPVDKREKLITLTPEGAKLLQNVYIGFSTIPDILVDMTDEQKIFLVERLKKLDDFHTNHQ